MKKSYPKTRVSRDTGSSYSVHSSAVWSGQQARQHAGRHEVAGGSSAAPLKPYSIARVPRQRGGWRRRDGRRRAAGADDAVDGGARASAASLKRSSSRWSAEKGTLAKTAGHSPPQREDALLPRDRHQRLGHRRYAPPASTASSPS